MEASLQKILVIQTTFLGDVVLATVHGSRCGAVITIDEATAELFMTITGTDNFDDDQTCAYFVRS